MVKVIQRLSLNEPINRKWIASIEVLRRILDDEGYVHIRVKNHPIIGSISIQEHRLVMMEKLNRKLKKGEIVHHKDDNRKNNNPKNLIVMKAGAHVAMHNRERDISEKTRKKMSLSRIGNQNALGHRWKRTKKSVAKMWTTRRKNMVGEVEHERWAIETTLSAIHTAVPLAIGRDLVNRPRCSRCELLRFYERGVD